MDNAAVSFRLPEEGPGGTFMRGLRTEIAITTPDGRASVREIVTGKSPGPFQIRVTAIRDSIRAGTVIDQYISDAPVRKSKAGNSLVSSKSSKSSNKWMLWTAVAGGAIAAGLVAGMARGSAKPGGSTPAPVAVPPSIGNPDITIAGPK